MLVCAILLTACGGAGLAPGTGGVETAAGLRGPSAWPATLPHDALQPWEVLSATGSATLREADARGARSVNDQSVFLPGVERFQDGGSAMDAGEACRLASGNTGDKAVSFAIYRLSLDGVQPGVVSADVNRAPGATGGGAGYYIGLSDYAKQSWEWHGPFTDNHVRLGRSAAGLTGKDLLASTNYLSPLGNLFITILAFDGAAVDVVGVGANPQVAGDSTAPPAPAGLTVTPAQGGLLLQWNSVIAGDLAGYRIYTSLLTFSDATRAGAKRESYLEGATMHFVPLTGFHYAAVAAVDINGNESALSNVVAAAALTGSAPVFGVELTQPSVRRGDALSLSVVSSDSLLFDYDLDGDGVFEVTGSTDTSMQVDTMAAGIIRPWVRATDAGGQRQAFGGVSLIVIANTRPVASATANPATGFVPINVTFTGEAEDAEDALDDLSFAWDFNGDGVFEAATDTLTPPEQAYAIPSMFNVKLRVTDTLGAWDVDTVSVLALADPDNQLPQISGLGANPSLVEPGTQLQFSCSASDAEGPIASYAWDFDNDGATESTVQNPLHTYNAAGLYNARLTVTDGSGGQSTATVAVSVENNPANLPPVITEYAATPAGGDIALNVEFSYNASDPNGTIAEYALDFENDGVFDFTAATSGSHSTNYATAGFYTACLRVTDNGGAQSRSYLSINATAPGVNLPPVITQFKATPSSGVGPLDVDFNFAATDPDGSITQYAVDYTDDGTDDATAGTAGVASTTYSTPGLVNAKLRVTDNEGAISVAYISIFVSETDTNIPPVAMLTASRTTGFLGRNTSLSVDFDASGSYDPEGGALEYAFDPEGDGSFSAYGSDPTQSFSYSTPGMFLTAMKVRDAGGKESTASFLIKVYRFNPQVLDSSTTAGSHAAITALTGSLSARIGMAYYESGTDDLMFTRSLDQTGTNWLAPVVLDSNGGEYCCFMQGVSQFNLAYYRDSDLFFKASQNDGTTFNISATVDTGGTDDVGQYCSIAFVQSNPAIAYHNETDGDLYYVRATTSSGSTWGTPVLVHSTGDTGEYTSLTVAGGVPVIAFYRRSTGDLHFVRASDATGTAWLTPQVVDAGSDDRGRFASLLIVGGNPAIAYGDATNADAYYVRATSATGATWGTPVLVSSTAGDFIQLRNVNGKPTVFFSADVASPNIYFAESLDSVGGSWDSTRLVEGDASGLYTTASVMTNGLPIVGYQRNGLGARVMVPKLD